MAFIDDNQNNDNSGQSSGSNQSGVISGGSQSNARTAGQIGRSTQKGSGAGRFQQYRQFLEANQNRNKLSDAVNRNVQQRTDRASGAVQQAKT